MKWNCQSANSVNDTLGSRELDGAALMLMIGISDVREPFRSVSSAQCAKGDKRDLRAHCLLKVAFRWVLFVFLCVSPGCVWPDFGDATPAIERARERARCKDQCKAIWRAIERFVAEHGDVPRDEAGNFCLERLGLPSTALVCPSSHRRYLVLRTLNVQILESRRAAEDAVPIVFDAPGSHPWSGAVDFPVLLFSDGRVRAWPCTREDYRRWVRKYLKQGISSGSLPPQLKTEIGESP